MSILFQSRLTKMQKCAAVVEKASCIQGCTGKMKAAGWESQALLIFRNYKTDWSSVPVLDPSVEERR